MKREKLDNLIKGWFVGDFEPSLYKTDSTEVAVKHYKAGDKEEWHYHKVATEITVIVVGRVKMCDTEFCSGEIVVIEPGKGTAFEALEDTITTVVKIPGAKNDKYMKGE